MGLAELTEIALRERNDLQASRLGEQRGAARINLAKSNATPNVAGSVRYTRNKQIIDFPPALGVSPFPQTDNALTFGVSVEIPIFNRNQDEIASATGERLQAQRTREFLEATVRRDVAVAYRKYKAAAESLVEDATVTANITTSEGANVAENLPTKFEKGFYRGSYAFASAENYKIVFNAATADKRNFSVDFPVSVVKSPINRTFWIGMAVLSLLAPGTFAAAFIKTGRGEKSKGRARLPAPLVAAALLIFALGTFALAYLTPPRQARSLAGMPPIGTNTESAPETANALETALTVPKESQILFGIKTEPVSVRQITSGLKTTGVVRARPDAKAVVVPPVAGRIVLRAGITLGSAVGRGEQIGTVEQILDVSGQTELESQRLEVEAQQREIESKRLEIRNSILQLQAQQADQRAKAGQARTQLAQAQR